MYDPSDESFRELAEGDLPLGVDQDAEYPDYSCNDLPEYAVIVAGTDGIWEARNPQDEMFGKDRMRDVIQSNASNPSSEIARTLEDTLKSFVATAPVKDDVTFVIMKLVAAHKIEIH